MIFPVQIKRNGVDVKVGTASVERLKPGNSRDCFGVDFYFTPEAAALFNEAAEVALQDQLIDAMRLKERFSRV